MIVDQELNFTIYARLLTKDRHFQDKTDVTSTDQAFNTGGSKHGPNKVPSKRQRTNKHPQQRCIVWNLYVTTDYNNCILTISKTSANTCMFWHCRLSCWTWKWCRNWCFQQGRRTRRGVISILTMAWLWRLSVPVISLSFYHHVNTHWCQKLHNQG